MEEVVVAKSTFIVSAPHRFGCRLRPEEASTGGTGSSAGAGEGLVLGSECLERRFGPNLQSLSLLVRQLSV